MTYFALVNKSGKSTLISVGLDWVPNTSHKGYANAYHDYLDGRNLWLSYTYSF